MKIKIFAIALVLSFSSFSYSVMAAPVSSVPNVSEEEADALAVLDEVPELTPEQMKEIQGEGWRSRINLFREAGLSLYDSYRLVKWTIKNDGSPRPRYAGKYNKKVDKILIRAGWLPHR